METCAEEDACSLPPSSGGGGTGRSALPRRGELPIMGIFRAKHDDLPLLVRVSDEHDVTSKLTISITLGDEHCSFSRFIIVFE